VGCSRAKRLLSWIVSATIQAKYLSGLCLGYPLWEFPRVFPAFWIAPPPAQPWVVILQASQWRGTDALHSHTVWFHEEEGLFQSQIPGDPTLPWLLAAMSAKQPQSQCYHESQMGTFALMSASRAIAVVTCHNPLRNVQSSSVPCNPTAVVSMCCRAEYYCLSNNVHFNGFRYNLFPTKGCTNPK
jgi:hypothetical protein